METHGLLAMCRLRPPQFTPPNQCRPHTFLLRKHFFFSHIAHIPSSFACNCTFELWRMTCGNLCSKFAEWFIASTWRTCLVAAVTASSARAALDLSLLLTIFVRGPLKVWGFAFVLFLSTNLIALLGTVLQIWPSLTDLWTAIYLLREWRKPQLWRHCRSVTDPV